MPSLFAAVRDLDRLQQIARVLAKHGFREVLDRSGLGSLLGGKNASEAERPSVAVRIRMALEELGPAFVKLGQIASTRHDLVPAEIVLELKKLQDDVPPEPFERIQKVIESELGGRVSDIFLSIDETPLASASIGQVHRARLKLADGEADVVVKVQRPGVREIVEKDVELLYWLAHAIERSVPEMRLYRPVRMVGEFDRSIMAELDYGQEADNCERFRRNFQSERKTRFPAVYRQASSRRVLTLEYLEGRKIYDAVEAGASGRDIARLAIRSIIQQVFEDGFFHADPHPGNVILMGELDDPVLGLVDLGMVGRLSPQMRDRVIDLMVAAVREDHRGIADALYAIGTPTKKIDRAAYEAEVALLADKYLGKRLGEIHSAGLIRDLVLGAQKYGIEAPPDFLMLGKSLVTVEGVGKEIDPELDLFEEARPYFLRLIQQRYNPERLSVDLMRGMTRVSGALTEMPVQMQEILEDLRKGAFRIQITETDLEAATDALGRRAFSGLVVGSLIVAAGTLGAAEQWWPAAGAAVAALGYATVHQWMGFWARRARKRRAKLRGD